MYRYYGEKYGDTECIKYLDSRIKTLDDLFDVIKQCWSKDTAYYPLLKYWSEDNPSYLQCQATAMIVQDLFGGTIRCVYFSETECHYFNYINSHFIDFTSNGYLKRGYPKFNYYNSQTVSREYLEQFRFVKMRYKKLKTKVNEYLDSIKYWEDRGYL